MNTLQQFIAEQRPKMELRVTELMSTHHMELIADIPTEMIQHNTQCIFTQLLAGISQTQQESALCTFVKTEFGLDPLFPFGFKLRQTILTLCLHVALNKIPQLKVSAETSTQFSASISWHFEKAQITLAELADKEISKIQTRDQKLISDLKLAKDNLQSEVDFLYLALKQFPVSLVGCGEELRIRLWNLPATRLTGFSQSEMLQKELKCLFSIEDYSLIEKFADEAGKTVKKLPVNIKTQSGEYTPVLLYLRKIEQQVTTRVRFLINFIDLRQEAIIRSQVEEIDRLNTISRMSGMMMHDVRNPVNTIGLNLEVIEKLLEKEGELTDRIKSFIDKSFRQIDRLSALLTEYLGYSRIQTIKPQPVDIILHLNELASEFRIAANPTVTIHYSPPQNPHVISADWQQLRRVFANLLQNALEAIDENGNIWINVKKRESRLLVGVRDDGCGIDNETAKSLFQPFFTTKPSGTGLGLFIAREIVKTHGGRLSVKQPKSRGTLFTVSFPIAEEADQNS